MAPLCCAAVRLPCRFDDAKASVQGPLDSAQSAVNSLQSQLDGLSCSIWHPQDCAEEAALEPVLEAAKVTLDGAQAAFNAVMNGAPLLISKAVVLQRP
jgi:hypothetical protein